MLKERGICILGVFKLAGLNNISLETGSARGATHLLKFFLGNESTLNTLGGSWIFTHSPNFGLALMLNTLLHQRFWYHFPNGSRKLQVNKGMSTWSLNFIKITDVTHSNHSPLYYDRAKQQTTMVNRIL